MARKVSKRAFSLALATLFVTSSLALEPIDLGPFSTISDVGDLSRKTLVTFDRSSGIYFVSAAGENIWGQKDAFGFVWRDDDPGGLQSQLWLIDARTAEDEAARIAGQQRILAYNEDDVRATAALRAALTS